MCTFFVLLLPMAERRLDQKELSKIFRSQSLGTPVFRPILNFQLHTKSSPLLSRHFTTKLQSPLATYRTDFTGTIL